MRMSIRISAEQSSLALGPPGDLSARCGVPCGRVYRQHPTGEALDEVIRDHARSPEVRTARIVPGQPLERAFVGAVLTRDLLVGEERWSKGRRLTADDLER